MKKRKLKNLDLKKSSISNLNTREIKGGTFLTFSCLSCAIPCPTLDCTYQSLCLCDPVEK